LEAVSTRGKKDDPWKKAGRDGPESGWEGVARGMDIRAEEDVMVIVKP